MSGALRILPLHALILFCVHSLKLTVYIFVCVCLCVCVMCVYIYIYIYCSVGAAGYLREGKTAGT